MISRPDFEETALAAPSTPLSEEETIASVAVPQKSPPGSGSWERAGSGNTIAPGLLPNGAIIGNRYEILALLGEGGMGSVYKARDRELDRVVALKIIKPELSRQRDILERFKQELILARQITHKNVIRIYDLGTADGVKFITMEFVEGRDLSSIIAKRRLTVEETVRIMRQVCGALEAAHAERVIHRDLKPQNIMVEAQGRVCVMDFGLARSMEVTGLTQAGALMGTPTYMSPEQAKGLQADHRSDIFALGIIFYRLLTGVVPFVAETLMGTLLKRTQEPAPPPMQLDPAIPEQLSNIVSKCLVIDLNGRYQSVTELLADLNAWAEGVPGLSVVVPRQALAGGTASRLDRRRILKWAAVSAGVAVFAGGNYYLWDRTRLSPAAKHQPVLLLVSDIKNNTGDPVLNGTLEPMLTTALEAASFINAYPRNEARRVAAQLQPGTSGLDETVARLVARREAIHYVLAGTVDADGGGYRLTLRVIEPGAGKQIFTETLKASNKQSVTGTVNKFAAHARKALGDDTEESLQLAAAETFSATSLEAANFYAKGQELQWAGKWDEASQMYLKAIDFDPNFGRAYASLAAVNANMGQRQAAEEYYKKAMERVDRMSDREKYRSRGVYYLMMRNHGKAIEEFNALLKQYPGDTAGLSNLAFAYHLRRDMAQAVKEGRRAVETYPNYLLPRHNLAVYARYAGDFSTAEKEERAVLQVNPTYLMAHAGVALSQLARSGADQAAETYRAMSGISPRGASYGAMGLADIALYRGSVKEATALLEKALPADESNKNAAAAAKKLAVLAWAYAASANKGRASETAKRALETGSSDFVRYTAAMTYIEAGQEAKAREISAAFSSKLEPDPQSYAKLIEGEIELKRGKAPQAVRAFTEAIELSDTWLARFARGRAYIEAGAFTEAYADLDACLKRQGEATEVFLDDVATYHLAPPVYYYLGRAQEGLRSNAALESYRKFLAIREKGDVDPMVTDARRRLSKPSL